MPTEFQKLMNLFFVNVYSVIVYIDDLLVVTKGAHNEHLNKCEKILEEANPFMPEPRE